MPLLQYYNPLFGELREKIYVMKNLSFIFLLAGLLACNPVQKNKLESRNDKPPIIRETPIADPPLISKEKVEKESVSGNTKQNVSKNWLEMVKEMPDNICIVGVWEMIPGRAYTTIYKKGSVYFMQDLFTENGIYGEAEKLVKQSANSYRFLEDTGETFEISDNYMNGYIEGDLSCQWLRVM